MPTLHLIGVPHTVPNEDFAVCAYTNKVRLFPTVLKPFGWRVIEYAHEGSDSDADEHVTLLSAADFQALSKRKSRDDDHSIDVDNKPLKDAYQRALMTQIRVRAAPGDVVGHIWGPNIEVYNLLPGCHHVELCVGYSSTPGLPFRVFETSAWMHWHYGKGGKDDGEHYKFVIPSPIDSARWTFCETPQDYALYFGRITPRKGMDTLLEIAQRMPQLTIRACGPGDPSQWASRAPPNLTFDEPVFGPMRVQMVQRASVMLMPTQFIEPFGNSGVEAQLCGVPLIGASYGAFQETIVEGVTGYRCHTLADWTAAIRMSFRLNRRKIATLARERYSKETIGADYDAALRQVADLSGRGWYSARSRRYAQLVTARRIWLYLPYFGSLPSYFQLYLDSLGRNEDCLSVIMLTDIDLTAYELPPNLVVVRMTLDELRERIARFIKAQFDVEVEAGWVQTPHKLTDFKITYPALFNDIGEQHGVKANDFVGWGDCDLIYGKLSDFLDLDAYHVIGGLFGHFTALRNTPDFKTLFFRVPKLWVMLMEDQNHVVDEIPFRKPLMDFVRQREYQIARIDRDFCDVIPEVFFGMFPTRTSDFFDSTHPERELRHIHVARDGRLTVAYQDGTTRPAIYCHLQKRRMARPFAVEETKDGYFIGENAFFLERQKAKPSLQFEAAFWGDCTDTLREEAKQCYVYARLMGLGHYDRSFDVNEKRILDIGGGPVSMLLKTRNLKEGRVCDPLKYPNWTIERYRVKNITVDHVSGEDVNESGWDEVWIYNVLQHVVDPQRVIANALRAAPVLRLFEWIDCPPYQGHPHMLTEAGLNAWLGQKGQTIELNETGCVGRAYYGVFQTAIATGAAA